MDAAPGGGEDDQDQSMGLGRLAFGPVDRGLPVERLLGEGCGAAGDDCQEREEKPADFAHRRIPFYARIQWSFLISEAEVDGVA